MLQRDALEIAPERWAPGDLAVSVWHGVSASDYVDEQARGDIQHEAEQRLRDEHERMMEDVRAIAYEEGRVAGESAERERIRGAITAAEAALDSIRENEAKWQECVSENIAALAVTIARHVVGREISSNPAGIAELVRLALTEFPIDQAMRVRVNPHDLSLLTLPVPEGSGDAIVIAPNRDVRWMADSRIQPGGCVVEGRERIIDGRVDTALERLYRQLTRTNA